MITRQQTEALSIVVPTLNEADNVLNLFAAIDRGLSRAGVPYEIIIIDDCSSDDTVAIAQQYAERYNVRVYRKEGQPGKAYSLLEGFDKAAYSIVCMIDADLQYPPAAIAPMYKLLTTKNADVIITERHNKETSGLRQLSSRIFNFLFVRLLFGITFDTQSGLKLFRKRVLSDFEMTPSPWSFDLEFLVRTLENERTIISYPIQFAERSAGVTKVKLLSTTIELAKASLALRWRTSARKLRRGHRANLQFLERVFSIMIVTCAFGAAMMGLSTHNASALTLPTTDTDLSPVMSALVEPSPADGAQTLPIITSPIGDITAADAPMAMVAASAASAPNTATGNNTGSLQTATKISSSQTPANLSAHNNQSSNKLTVGVTGNRTNGLRVLSGQTAAMDTADFAAATATRPANRYSGGYPTAHLSQRLQRDVHAALLIALWGGVGTVFAGILFTRSSAVKLLKPQRLLAK